MAKPSAVCPFYFKFIQSDNTLYFPIKGGLPRVADVGRLSLLTQFSYYSGSRNVEELAIKSGFLHKRSTETSRVPHKNVSEVPHNWEAHDVDHDVWHYFVDAHTGYAVIVSSIAAVTSLRRVSKVGLRLGLMETYTAATTSYMFGSNKDTPSSKEREGNLLLPPNFVKKAFTEICSAFIFAVAMYVLYRNEEKSDAVTNTVDDANITNL
jgi:hypothetical protein